MFIILWRIYKHFSLLLLMQFIKCPREIGNKMLTFNTSFRLADCCLDSCLQSRVLVIIAGLLLAFLFLLRVWFHVKHFVCTKDFVDSLQKHTYYERCKRIELTYFRVLCHNLFSFFSESSNLIIKSRALAKGIAVKQKELIVEKASRTLLSYLHPYFKALRTFSCSNYYSEPRPHHVNPVVVCHSLSSLVLKINSRQCQRINSLFTCSHRHRQTESIELW